MLHTEAPTGRDNTQKVKDMTDTSGWMTSRERQKFMDSYSCPSCGLIENCPGHAILGILPGNKRCMNQSDLDWLKGWKECDLT
jgi:hypothetical protein